MNLKKNFEGQIRFRRKFSFWKMNINIESLINLNIFTTKLLDIDNNFLSKNILDNLNTPNVPGFLESHNHTYHEDTILNESEELNKLITEIEIFAGDVTSRKYILESIWGLVLNKGQSVMMHTHKSNRHMRPEEYYSIAYYPQVPEGSADLIFSLNYCNIIEEVKRIKPEEGLLVMFNSYIPHMTSDHKSQIPRIVISANVAPENPNTEIVPDWSPYKLRNSND